jgi:hypothetical protein
MYADLLFEIELYIEQPALIQTQKVSKRMRDEIYPRIMPVALAHKKLTDHLYILYTDQKHFSNIDYCTIFEECIKGGQYKQAEAIFEKHSDLIIDKYQNNGDEWRKNIINAGIKSGDAPTIKYLMKHNLSFNSNRDIVKSLSLELSINNLLLISLMHDSPHSSIYFYFVFEYSKYDYNDDLSLFKYMIKHIAQSYIIEILLMQTQYKNKNIRNYLLSLFKPSINALNTIILNDCRYNQPVYLRKTIKQLKFLYTYDHNQSQLYDHILGISCYKNYHKLIKMAFSKALNISNAFEVACEFGYDKVVRKMLPLIQSRYAPMSEFYMLIHESFGHLCWEMNYSRKNVPDYRKVAKLLIRYGKIMTCSDCGQLVSEHF